ncbi:hypothetical protein A1O7_08175 [Cladophialophora yegresii CBS 114405]|uniref:ATPase synthesis protein 25 n=1 Tax=Cladophialophora yegresii CBS 114405 TaxID=1182544 RepID=W9W9L7_9EURO|nr:uncharacterized protein A1O7_08175 [Cladophialophora yegresii CBS 114405]EXJ55249.1 hypothetical protein A1O7_08175 [Cladophialophora yegresii CBS 114405]
MNRSIVRCTSCRGGSVLEAVGSLAGVQVSIPAQASRSRLSTQPPPLPRFQSTRKLSSRSQFGPLRQSLQTSDTSSASDPFPPPPQPPSSADSIQVPWYLQIEDPLPPSPISPLLALQEIPPLPANPPAILATVLTHLSTQIGLDNLVLLDLRHLDPPPALGSNLLMVIGTARSVKHLNVSADRFCRWARKEFKLRPYADGLLGRNELKLKLRRKARRMKLAQSVGNTVSGHGADDGITTGWICVNMGSVDEAVLSEEMPAEEIVQVQGEAAGEVSERARRKAQESPLDGEEEYHNPGEDEYVGFGSRSNAPRIVVQMFTEEKRVEMDLEGLWDVRNTRRARRDERATAAAEAAIQMLQHEQEQGKQTETEKKDESEEQDDDNAGERKERGGETRIEEEVDDPEAREEDGDEKPLGGIGAS